MITKNAGYIIASILLLIEVFYFLNENISKSVCVDIVKSDSTLHYKCYEVPHNAILHQYKDKLQYQNKDGQYIDLEYNVKSYKLKR